MGDRAPPCSPALSTKITALSKSSGKAGLTFIHSINSLVKLVKNKTPSPKKTPKLAPSKSRGPKHHLLTLSIKVTISKHKKKRDDSDDDDREEGGDGSGLWQKGILLGDKCEPLDFSGVIYYDNKGNQLPEFPARSPTAASSIINQSRSLHPPPNISRQRLPLAAASFSRRQPLEKISEKSERDGRRYKVKLKKLTSSVRGVLNKLPHLKHRKGNLVPRPRPADDSVVGDNFSSTEYDVVSRTPNRTLPGTSDHDTDDEYTTKHPILVSLGTWVEHIDLESPAKQGGNRWLITGDEPGGPIEAAVIPSFGGHVARDVWAGIERGPLKYQNQNAVFQSLKAWRWNSPEAQAMAAKSGLTHLSGVMHMEIDMNLVSAFVERWQPDTNTFHMPFGEMTILLHDVDKILGIPVEGLAIEECYAAVAEVFGVTVGDRLNQGQGGVPNSYLYATAVETSDHEKHAQLMLAYLLGNTLFPDKSGRVKSCIFPLLKDTDKVSDNALGAATLANLYRELGMASRAESQYISGCLTLLQAWIYEYFPSLSPPPIGTPLGCPRAARWEPSYIAPSDQKMMQYYRENLDMMRPEHVNWMPFGGGMDEEVPTTLYAGLIRFGSIIEPYNPTRVLRQLGYRQHIPMLKLIEPLEVRRDRAVSKYTVKFDESAADWFWNSGITIPRSVKLEPVIPGNECSEEYFTWFRRVSHPRIGNLTQPSSSQSTIDLVEEMGSLTLSNTYGIGPYPEESDRSD